MKLNTSAALAANTVWCIGDLAPKPTFLLSSLFPSSPFLQKSD